MLKLAIIFLVAGLVLGALGYVWGACLSAAMRPEQVISWVLVLTLPITLPAALWTRPLVPVQAASWLGFAYVALFSMWIGFFAWYRGLALGGTVRVSQVQLLQPFLGLGRNHAGVACRETLVEVRSGGRHRDPSSLAGLPGSQISPSTTATASTAAASKVVACIASMNAL